VILLVAVASLSFAKTHLAQRFLVADPNSALLNVPYKRLFQKLPVERKVPVVRRVNRMLGLVNTGKRAASVLARARVLLKADADGPNWSDPEIAEAFEVSLSTVHRGRQAFVEEGLQAALERKKPTGRQYRKLDGAQEARLIALACGKPPQGRARWTLRLLADKLVELDIIDPISHECVRNTLKKTTCGRIARGSG
jgi:transposase